jgi:acetolactate synthase-1/2/3 large subunit
MEITTMEMTVAEAIVKSLEIEGIEYAFGITGSHLLGFFKALKNSKIKYISVKHENAAGLMAANYTKVSGKPALILATAGPGAANLVNGVTELYKSNLPGFILTPIVPTTCFGKNAFQEDSGYGSSYSIVQIMQQITRKSLLGIKSGMINNYMQELFRYALCQPYGPVYLGVPTDLFAEEIEFIELNPCRYRLVNDQRIEQAKIDKTFSYLKNAKSPLLLIGSHCRYPDCSDVLEKLISISNIPFVLSFGAKGIVDEHHELCGGVLDYFGHRSAEKFVKESDLIIALGMDFSEAETIKYDPELFADTTLITFCTGEMQTGINYPIEFGSIGNLPLIIKEFTSVIINEQYNSPWDNKEFVTKFKSYNEHQFDQMALVTEPLSVPCILHEISKCVGDESMIFMDGSAIAASSSRHLCANKNGYYTSSAGYSIAQGVAGVVGGKIACPEKYAFCISGDGAFLMHGMEVLTAVQYNLGITWIIFKDDLYNLININQCLMYGGELGFCTGIQNPDYRYLSKAFSVNYYEINSIGDIESSINNAKQCNENNESALIIVNYQNEEHLPVKPRMVSMMKDMGQTKNIQANPYLMRAFKKVLQEKV